MLPITRLWLIGVLLLSACQEDDKKPETDSAVADAAVLDAAARLPDADVSQPADDPQAQYQRALADYQVELDSERCGRSSFNDTGDAECLTTSLPLAWREPERGRIEVFAKRLPGERPAARQVWLLVGGPGAASVSGEAIVATLQQRIDDADFFLLDYRGVGRSQRLACPSEEAGGGNLPFDPKDDDYGDRAGRCFDEAHAEWGDDIFHFNLSETAMDLAALIEATRKPNVPVLLHGHSWGTAVAHAYLRLFPAGVDGVLMDSMVLPGLDLDRGMASDRVLRRVLERCASEPQCQQRLGDDPVAAAQALLQQLQGDHCPALAQAGIDVETMKILLAYTVTGDTLWPLAPTLVYRAQRCEPGDVEAIVALRESFAQVDYSFLPVKLSGVLQILLMRRLAPDDTLDEVRARLDDYLAADGSPLVLAQLRQAVPLREVDPFAGAWAQTELPMLITQGELDTATPATNGDAAEMHFTAPEQITLRFPNWGHTIVRQEPCGTDILAQWLQEPNERPNTDCADPEAFDLSLDEASAMRRLGRASQWDNP